MQICRDDIYNDYHEYSVKGESNNKFVLVIVCEIYMGLCIISTSIFQGQGILKSR